MSRRFRIWVVKEVLYAYQNLKSTTAFEDRVTCLIVIAGFQPSSSFRMERQTVPEG
jgi:hypothetical protein